MGCQQVNEVFFGGRRCHTVVVEPARRRLWRVAHDAVANDHHPLIIGRKRSLTWVGGQVVDAGPGQDGIGAQNSRLIARYPRFSVIVRILDDRSDGQHRNGQLYFGAECNGSRL